MRYQRDGFSVESKLAKGVPLPDWYLDEPLLDQADYFYLRAFDELNTCRPAGVDLSPIPWTAIISYGQHHGLCDQMQSAFVTIIRAMDETFHKWHNAEAKKGVPNASSGIGNKTVAK